jgi:hypothetical protein
MNTGHGTGQQLAVGKASGSWDFGKWQLGVGNWQWQVAGNWHSAIGTWQLATTGANLQCKRWQLSSRRSTINWQPMIHQCDSLPLANRHLPIAVNCTSTLTLDHID